MHTPIEKVGSGNVAHDLGGITARDAMRILFEASLSQDWSGSAPVDLQRLSHNEFGKLIDLLRKQASIFTEQEKQAIEKGEPQEIKKAILQARLRQAETDKAQRDGLTGVRQTYEALKAEAQDRLPEAGEEVQSPVVHRPAAPETDKNRLQGLRLEILQLLVDSTQSAKGGLPPQGMSRELHQIPLLQFAPEALRSVFSKIGLHNLREVLAALMRPQGRQLVAKATGLPRPALFLAALRAELLDLPVNLARGKLPHLKDVLLLARLGLGSPSALAALRTAIDKKPGRFELLAELIDRLQRQVPDLVGRQRITRFELREWCTAAARRNSLVTVEPWPSTPGQEVAVAAENILLWHQQQAHQDASRHCLDALLRALLLARLHGVRLDEDLQQRLQWELADELAAGASDELWRLLEEQRYWENAGLWDTHLFSDLAGAYTPAEPRADGLICFWMERPMGEIAADIHRGVDVQRAQYVCLNPHSGAIVPFSGGAG